ncbi:hypothetical protein HGRIS_009328 [Hohenbuehelia grisea]|uniref:non-specific serine/threonine protein kinase n=1 Tax=Hohenbuehelia grisea TaxID=104357 RepID=A0ABR3J0S2_9AGAR
MLGSRTKQVNTYGRRNQRIVTVSDDFPNKTSPPVDIFANLPTAKWGPVVAKMRKKTTSPKAKVGSPKVVHISKKRHLPARQPSNQAIVKQEALADLLRRRALASPGKKSVNFNETPRIPLSPFPVNILSSATAASPAPVSKPKPRLKRRLPSAIGTPVALRKASAPAVDIEIVILDNDGQTVSKERRVSGTVPNVRQATRAKAASKPKSTTEVTSLISSSDDQTPVFSPKKRPSRRGKVKRVVSDDEVGMSPEKPITIFSDNDVGMSPEKPIDIHSDSEAGMSPEKPISVYSADAWDSPLARKVAKAPLPVTQQQPNPEPFINEIVMPPVPLPIPKETSVSIPKPRSSGVHLHSLHIPVHIDSPYARPRQLTPIRGRSRKGIFYDPPSPPSPTTPTDFDLSLELDGLDLNDSLGFDASTGDALPAAKPEFAEYLLPLLTECHQEECGPYEFSSFIEAFPLDPSVRPPNSNGERLHFRKIGEASFSEVFGIGDVVLKIIPLYDGGESTSSRDHAQDEGIEGPPPSAANDVLKEIIVTRAMGEVGDGFVSLVKSYIVRGRYPEVLLDLWDEYLDAKGSESIRPDTFLVQQTYAIIVLPNGGPDLEAYTFSNASKTGWRQACSLFWQVTKTLGHAEQLVSFEHRDLHWGQVLVKDTPITYAAHHPLGAQDMNQRGKAPAAPRPMMDDQCHGVKATVIDLGLSRMDAGDGRGGEMVHWTPFDEEIFMGEGDYQFDVYRFMRDHNGNSWEQFKPLTNVMWLHYLALKLLKSKRLKAPRAPRKSAVAAAMATPARSSTRATASSAAFSERDCYEALVEIERLLGQTVAEVKDKAKTRGKQTQTRRKTIAPTAAKKVGKVAAGSRAENAFPPISCAGALVEYGVKKGWVNPVG